VFAQRLRKKRRDRRERQVDRGWRIPGRGHEIEEAAFMTGEDERIPARLSDDGRTATWNPALTRAVHVLLRVRLEDGRLEERRSVNSGRARVRAGETIEGVVAAVV
jgi:hypothetical protein